MQLTLPIDSKLETPKRMLEIKKVNGVTRYYINYSSLDIIQTCKRKAKYILHDKLVSGESNAATTFGSAVHRALETWYCAPKINRKRSSAECDDQQILMLNRQATTKHGECARCASVFSFLEAGHILRNLPETDKRSQQNGIHILNNYFNVYLSDPYVIVEDDMGPMCERSFELLIATTPHPKTLQPCEIYLFGTIDSILKNEQTGEIIVCDHKTTASLGKDFFNRIKPNHQYTGYFLGAKEVLGLDVKRFMVNGIQVAKTKYDLNRQFTIITSDDINELKLALLKAVGDYMAELEFQKWPMSAPNACTMWGGCTFREICILPPDIRKSVIEAKYNA